ncbi:MAG: PKD domain-containing protein, partial [Flavobacteriales bacterium]
MRKLFTGLFFMSLTTAGFAQDLAMAPPLGTFLSPATGCSLTATETVTIRIFNAGPTILAGTNIPVSYSINAGAPVNEVITLGANFVNNTTLNYTFTAVADLSVPGSYSIDATVALAGDVVPANNTYTGYLVVNNAASNGGTATGSTNVCITSNSGNITLIGNVGSVLNWEYSTDGGGLWVNISNTTTTQSYNDITVETWYRANVQNAGCPPATSTVAIVTVDPGSIGGTVTGGTTPACSGSNSGTLTNSGRTGSIIRWEFTTNGGMSWTPIANVTATQAYLNLTTTTGYRAVVQSGACPSANSTTRTITVNPQTVGGTVSSDATVCSGFNSGTLTLSGHVGAVLGWEFSTNGGGSWSPIANTTTSQFYSNLTQTTMYRARVRSNPCSVQTSSEVTITVVSASDGGTLNTSNTVCVDSNRDTLKVTGYVGSILNWEYSDDNGVLWLPYASTADTLIYENLQASRLYRVVVQAGGCPIVNSNAVNIQVDTLTVGGVTSGAVTVCASGNGGTVQVAGNNGVINQWEFSDNSGITWNPLANNSSSQSYSNLTSTRLFRVQVQNGVCPIGYSDTVTVTVDSITVGGTVSANTTVCSGANSGALNLVGNTGSVLNWELSTDGGFSWFPIANTTATQNYNNIAQVTQFRANVQSGVCPPAVSGFAIITVDAQSVGGTLYGGTTVCETANSGTLTLIGYNASIVGWEETTDGGTSWFPIANTTPFFNFNNLTITTEFRVITASGVCPNDTSSSTVVIVDPATLAGVVTANDTVCAGANSGTLFLNGQTGSVINWEMSTDNSIWITLSNNGITQDYLNLLATTSFRAKVQSGVCPAIGSTPASITVNAQSNGGEVNSSATVCAGQNFGILNLFGQVGNIIDWEFSTDQGTSWTPVGNTTTTQNYVNLVDTTWYRVIVQSGICPADSSDYAYINLYPSPEANFNSDTVCQNQPLAFVNTTTNPIGFVTLYSWDFGDGGTSLTANPSHIYSSFGTFTASLFAMNSFGCTDTAMRTILVNNLPVADIFPSGPTSFCDGGSVDLTAPFNINYSYLWNTGDNNFQ